MNRPAPIWRRCAALVYDGLLLAGLLIAASAIGAALRSALQLSGDYAIQRAMLLLIGFAFFGRFWTRGGQTLGLRAWRLRVQRLDGAPLRWPIAALRYAAGLLPLLAALWGWKQLGGAGALLAVLNYLPCSFDPRKRAGHDFIAGTEVVLLAPSMDPPQPPQREQDQQRAGQAG